MEIVQPERLKYIFNEVHKVAAESSGFVNKLLKNNIYVYFCINIFTLFNNKL